MTVRSQAAVPSPARLAGYAALAGTAGLLGQQSADAGGIPNSGASAANWSTSLTFGYGDDDDKIDSFGPGGALLTAASIWFTFSDLGGDFRNLSFSGSNVSFLHTGEINSVQRLGGGAAISAGAGEWDNGNGLMAFSGSWLGPGDRGGWQLSDGTGADAVRGYLGFRLDAGNSAYWYGWFDVELSRTGTDIASTMTLTIHGWAYEYETTAMSTPGGAVPGIGGLAALAMGAAGVRTRRKRHADHG